MGIGCDGQIVYFAMAVSYTRKMLVKLTTGDSDQSFICSLQMGQITKSVCPCQAFKSSQIFASKARSLPKREAPENRSTQVGSGQNLD